MQVRLSFVYNKKMPDSFTLPLVKKEMIAQDTCSFYFDRRNIRYNFFPGQYNRITLAIHATDGRGSSRFFTICSSPLEKDYLMITTKRGKSSYKRALFDLAIGEKADFFGPIGGFYLHEEDIHPKVFLAGGIGITPFHSMITYAREKKLSIPLTLFVSFSTPEEMIFFDTLTSVAKENSAIKIVYTITHPEKSNEKWMGETGRISEDLIKKYIEDIMKIIYMIVGPPPMVDGTVELLQTMGIPQNQIKVEHFTGY
jgi:ferredoxin-NADP reductase